MINKRLISVICATATYVVQTVRACERSE